MTKTEHDLRHKALLAALMGTYSNLNADAVVSRARAFEQYLANGQIDPGPADNSIDGQITRAFTQMGASVDDISGV
jgi:hypothetical protein